MIGETTLKEIANDWKEALGEEFEKPYYKNLMESLKESYATKQIFPPEDEVFNAFNYTPLREVKVVIIGQDPYHNEKEAEGLCFSVKKGINIPPSLRNIYKELEDDLGCSIPSHGSLVKWAKQGVLLLNTVLTVDGEKKAASHKGIGWEKFTDATINVVNNLDKPIVFILWGKPAQMKRKMLTNERHLILEAPHPSPLSSYRGFFGSKPFSKTNTFLRSQNELEIDWKIDEI